MSKYFDAKKLDKCISNPNWYLQLQPAFKELEQNIDAANETDKESIKDEFYSYIEEKLENEVIPLNGSGPDWDDERKRIDTIIIHHTSNENPQTLERLNVKQMLNIYMPFFLNPNEENKNIKGQALSSMHFRNSKHVFFAYHWLVRLDGTYEKLLEDRYIGWHAGNWDVNTRSIAICIDGNLENSAPPQKVLTTIAQIIKANYQDIATDNILGHCEVNPKTICPGNLFLADWKKDLTRLLNIDF